MIRLISLYCNTNENYEKDKGKTFFAYAQDLDDGRVRWFKGAIDNQKLFEILKPHLEEKIE